MRKFRDRAAISAAAAALAIMAACAFGSGDAMDSYRSSGDPLFVAVVNDTTKYSYISEDGQNWRMGGALPLSDNYTSIAYGEGKFIAARNATANQLSVSPDAIHWESRDISAFGNSIINTVIYRDQMFVAGGTEGLNGKFFYSYNDTDWKAGTFESASGEAVFSISHGNGIFFAMAGSGIQLYYTSSDGINWGYEGSPMNGVVGNVAYGNTIFVIVGQRASRGDIYASPDGSAAHLSNALVSDANCAVTGVVYGRKKFVAVEYNSATAKSYSYTSDSGIAWKGPYPIEAADGSQLNKVIFGNDRYIAVGMNGTIVVSDDGRSWSGNMGPGGSGVEVKDICYRP